jgi:hypothetical protein
MYVSRIPFTRDTNKGPQPVGKKSKKATKPVVVESVIEEPAKIEVIDEITEPAEVTSEEPTDANS